MDVTLALCVVLGLLWVLGKLLGNHGEDGHE